MTTPNQDGFPIHAAFYGEEVFRSVSEYNDRKFAAFSNAIVAGGS